MIITHLSFADAQAMSEIHHSFNFPWERPWSTEEYEKMLKLHSVEGFGAYLLDELIGFIILQFAADTADILFIGVKADFHHQEMGRKLLETAEVFLSSKEVREIYLEVCVMNKNAVEFYNKSRYINNLLRTNYYNINSINFDALVMKKLL